MKKYDQKQKAGNYSQQQQANTIINITGITEDRARAIFDESIKSALIHYSTEAKDMAIQRIKRLEDDVIPKIVAKNLLESLKDPSIQVLILDAQKTATQTDRVGDYALLSELIIHRIEKGNTDKHSITGINRAIEIIDEISDEALLAITISHAVIFTPLSPSVSHGLEIINNIFEKLLYSKLPINDKWIEQLDILDAVRINSFGSLKKLKDYYTELLQGYVLNGIKMDSQNHVKALQIIKDNNLPEYILVQHELNTDYLLVPVPNKENIKNLIIDNNPITQTQIDALIKIFDLYDNDKEVYKNNVGKFIDMWNSFKNLKTISEWWDNIKISFSITSVGRVLAHSNAQRCDPNLPRLN